MKFKTFEDFDDFASSVRDVDSTMMLQNPTRYIWKFGQIYLPDIHIQMGEMGCGNIVEGKSTSSGYLIYLTLTDRCQSVANGRIIDKNSFMILEPGCDFFLTIKSEHDWCSIFIPTDKLTGVSDLVESSSSSHKIMKCRVTLPNPRLVDHFRKLVRPIISASNSSSKFESSPAGIGAQLQLLKLASLILREVPAYKQHKHKDGRPKLSRKEIILSTKKLLEEQENKPIFVRELAVAARVSERTLRNAFKESFGFGPIRYLQMRRLHQVHIALQKGLPETTSVTDVLIQHGEWHFGYFASQYRRLFGELPSETLQRKLPTPK